MSITPFKYPALIVGAVCLLNAGHAWGGFCFLDCSSSQFVSASFGPLQSSSQSTQHEGEHADQDWPLESLGGGDASMQSDTRSDMPSSSAMASGTLLMPFSPPSKPLGATVDDSRLYPFKEIATPPPKFLSKA